MAKVFVPKVRIRKISPECYRIVLSVAGKELALSYVEKRSGEFHACFRSPAISGGKMRCLRYAVASMKKWTKTEEYAELVQARLEF